MALNVKLDSFEGPFDLLFHLIEQNQIDIYDIPIAQVADQYMDYLKNMKENQLELASEFLVMAATLLSIKSRMLLPGKKDDHVQLELSIGTDEIDPRKKLVDMLVEYKKYKDIAGILKSLEEEQRKIFKKSPEDLSYLWNGEFTLSNLNLDDMKSIFLNLVINKKRQESPHVLSRDPYPLSKRIREVYKIILAKSKIFFSRLINKNYSKTELVVTFLAVLELIKMNKISALQKNIFDDILVVKKEGSDGRK